MKAPNDRDRDDLVLDQLCAHGDVGLIPRPVCIWIYGAEDDLQTAAARMAGGNWEIEIEQYDERWVLRAEREQPANDEAIHAMSAEILAAIKGTDADYDGWETSVERSH